MVSPSSSFFSIHENAYWGMYPTTQLKMPKIFNMIFEMSLTKGGLGTFSCACDVSSRRSPFQCNFYLCMNNCLLLISSQNWLVIIQEVGIHDQMILMSRALSWVQGRPCFPFFTMNSCTLFRCIDSFHFVAYGFFGFL